ncbi:MAG: type II toxin-antitoxin system VapC family toxin [Anaerolineales bacterium]|nr:type II toxin-antitoxin system VapC family toxin [Anaerolineales bacterium]
MMEKSVLLDTDVLIDYLRGHHKAVDLVTACSSQIILSAIVVAELYAGVKGEKELRILDNFISLFRIVPVSVEIARAGGLYKKEYAPSHGVGLADGILAATAVAEQAEFKTLNVKHYPMIKGLAPAYHK